MLPILQTEGSSSGQGVLSNSLLHRFNLLAKILFLRVTTIFKTEKLNDAKKKYGKKRLAVIATTNPNLTLII